MKKIYFLLFALLGLATANAQLQPGAIAFTGYNSDAPDGFSFVTFVDIPAGVSIEFTDNGWEAAGDFRDNEGIGTWISSGITAGEQVIVSDIVSGTVNTGTYINNGMNLSGSGDQILAYNPNNIPGAGDDTGFYAGIHMNGTWDADATSSNTSSLPASITNFSIAIDPEVDNAFYDCNSASTSGTENELRTAVNNSANWTTTNTGSLTLTDCDFMITTLSTQDVEKTTFAMYPNPTTNGFVNIKISNNETTQVAVFDILGKQVINTTLTAERLNVSNLKAGVYAVRLSQGNTVTTKKLVIK